jgi:hypothetical protein
VEQLSKNGDLLTLTISERNAYTPDKLPQRFDFKKHLLVENKAPARYPHPSRHQQNRDASMNRHPIL